MRVFATKIALVTLCSGKIIDKLRYLYSLISDPNSGQMIPNRFNCFLRESMALACSVFETESYQFDDSLSDAIFDFNHVLSISDFIEIFVGQNGAPACLAWFVALHKMSETDNVVHPIQCDACLRQAFVGLRYKCQKCFSYTMCQDCFWRGRTSGSHNADTHPCKEFCYWQSQSQQIGQSLRKSFRCIPSQKPKVYVRDEPPARDKRINSAHSVPTSPNMGQGGPRSVQLHSTPMYGDSPNMGRAMMGPNGSLSSPINTNNGNANDGAVAVVVDLDEEHRLVAMYAHQLATYQETGQLPPKLMIPPNDALLNDFSSNGALNLKQMMIAQLEQRNREMMREIARIRQEESDIRRDQRALAPGEAIYVSELSALRNRKEELEVHLSTLQDSRKELLVQLEGLMKLLKNHGTLLSASASGSASMVSSMTRTPSANRDQVFATSTLSSLTSQDSDLSPQSNNSTLDRKHHEVMSAADSVTNAMSSLVKGLNSEDEATLEEMGLNLSKQLKLQENEKVKQDCNLVDKTSNCNSNGSESDQDDRVVSSFPEQVHCNFELRLCTVQSVHRSRSFCYL